MEAATPPPAPAPRPAGGPRQISVGEVLRDSFDMYRDHLGVLVAVGLGIGIVFGLIGGFVASGDSFILQLVGRLIISIGTYLYLGFVVKLVQDVRADGRRDFTAGELFSAAAPYILPLLVNAILLQIAVTIGFFLLVVPGLILMTIWAVCAPAIVVEDRGPIEAFGRSFELVRGQAWTVFGVIVSLFAILVALAVVTVVLAIVFLPIGLLLGVALLVLWMPVFAVATSTLFFDLGGGSEPSAQAPAA